MSTSLGRRRIAVVGAIAATFALVIAAPSGAAARPSGNGVKPARAVVGTHYATFARACSDDVPAGRASCDAIRLVPASKSTPGAHRYAVTAAAPVGPDGIGYTPGDLAAAYGVNPDASVPTQVVGIVDAYNDPNALADLNHFDENYGLPDETASSLAIVGETGSTTALPADDQTGWSTEESLDLDAVRGVCHRCRIVLVETDSEDDNDLAAGVATAVSLGATEVSNSYGGGELPGTAAAQEQANYNFPGVVITASTGDDGWYDWDNANYQFPGFGSIDTPEVPSSAPDVVAVGGTTLNLNDDGTRSSETVWNANGVNDATAGEGAAGATGGGCSTVYAARGWQFHTAGYRDTGCGVKRLAADISAVGDPNTGYDIYDTYSNPEHGVEGPGWATYGGTSLSSPVIAALWALAGGSGGVAYPSLSLYGHLASTPSSFYDVTSGGNGYCGGSTPTDCQTNGGFAAQGPNPNQIGYGSIDCAFPADTAPASSTSLTHITQCNAVPGFDGPSGVGTPNGLTGFTAMSPTATITLPASVLLNTSEDFTADVTDPLPGAVGKTYAWRFGDGTATVTTSNPTQTHTFTKAGHFTVRVTAHDNYGRTGMTTAQVVAGIAPTAAISGPTTGTAGTPLEFSGLGSTDPNTGGSIASYAWTWGKGGGPASTGGSPTHTFKNAGTYIVRLTVTDNAGLTRSTTQSIIIS